MDQQLTIQQVAAQTGLSEYTLRYYENIGLIETVGRAENGHRRYTAGDVGWIEFLKCLRATGMPVAEMRQYAELARSSRDTIAERLALLENHRSAVLAEIEELKKYVAVLDHKIDYYTSEKGLIEDAERIGTFGN